jgi:hypothetical protein
MGSSRKRMAQRKSGTTERRSVIKKKRRKRKKQSKMKKLGKRDPRQTNLTKNLKMSNPRKRKKLRNNL